MPHQSPNSDPLSPFFFFFSLILLIIPYLWLYSPQSFHSPFTYFSLHYFSFYQYSSFNLHLSFFDSSSSHFIFYKFTILSPIWSTYFPHKNCDCSLSLSLSLSFFSFLLVDFYSFLHLYFGWYVFVFLIALLCINTFWCNVILIAHHKSSLSPSYGFGLCKDQFWLRP